MTTIAGTLFSKKALPGWALIVVPQLNRLYALVDAWSNLEFIAEKVKTIQLLGAVAALFASAWFQISLILVGLVWIWLASSWSLRAFWQRRQGSRATPDAVAQAANQRLVIGDVGNRGRRF